MENGNGTSGADGGAAHISPYCGDMLVDLHDVYVHYHGYASLLVCAFGSVANVLNIAVLTRKEMVSPTNAILTGLAVADLLVMVEYVPFAYHMYLRPTNYPRADRFSYNWSLFVLLHSDFSQAFHTISIWLTVTLAVWSLSSFQKNQFFYMVVTQKRITVNTRNFQKIAQFFLLAFEV
ncbi:hypothetical protein AGLY_014611 [Aphis glycines]|uniref:G-protein coupled receptors family 1 profile domain-containing protein n=1 Tax=Aphis glycines TaxID=307491 RepID=A0A6G0T3R5_APHGL|nr:hypothetical protein AGLY_014611 [Aphis glycines]